MSLHHFKGDPNNLYLINADPSRRSTDRDEVLIGYRGIGEARIPSKIVDIISNYTPDQAFNIQEMLLKDLPHLLYLCILESSYVEFEEIE